MKIRTITDEWDVSQKPLQFKQDFREPTEVRITNFAPFFSKDKKSEYISFINRLSKTNHPQQSMHRYDDEHLMFGHYSNARFVSDEVWVTFTPKKIGDLWVSFHKNYEHYNEDRNSE